MQHTRYIIAQGFNDKEPDEETGIDYLPQSSLPIAIWSYFRYGPGHHGAGYSPAEVLQLRQRKLRELNADWFVPFLERMARGEDVPIDQINARHVELFGKELQKVPSPYPPQYDDDGHLRQDS